MLSAELRSVFIQISDLSFPHISLNMTPHSSEFKQFLSLDQNVRLETCC